MLTNVPHGAAQNNDFMITHQTTNCEHQRTEKRFVDYHFTLELYAIFCKKCNKQLGKLIAV